MTPIDGDSDLKTIIISQFASAQFRARLDQMGHDSLFNSTTGLSALLAGVGGRITIELPSRADGRVEVHWKPTQRRQPKPH